MKPTTSNHYSALAIAIAVFLVSVGGYAFIYLTINSQTVSTSKAITGVQDAQRVAAQQQNILTSLKATVDDRALVDNMLLSPNNTVPFIESIEALSKPSGADVSLVSITSDGANFHAHVNIQGSWNTTMRAMHLIENIPYSVALNNIKIGTSGKGFWSEDFDMTIPVATQ